MHVQSIRMVLGLDIGVARTGVAVANTTAKIPRPLVIIDGIEMLPDEVARLVRESDTVAVVIGLPQNANGHDTDQTSFVREQAKRIEAKISMPVYFVDESMTSIRAEKELQARKKPYIKGDIDMLAAVYILDDFLQYHYEALSDV